MTITELDPTILRLAGIGVPPYSARGLQQTLQPIDEAANIVRTINAALVDLSAPQFQKYKSTITGSDQKPPAVDGVWPGKVIIVDCIPELCTDEYGTPSRIVVEGSDHEEAGFLFYRPRLTMMVLGFTMTTDEYGAQVSWTMDLEEV